MPLILPSRFNQQPQFPAAIDRGNPLAKGLSHAWCLPKGGLTTGNGLKLLLDSAGNADGVFGTGSNFSGDYWKLDEKGYYLYSDNAGTGTFGSDAIALGDSSGSAWPVSTSFTASFFLRLDNSGSPAEILGGPAGGSANISIRAESSNAISLLKQGVASIGTASTALTVGTWSHVAVTYDGTNAAFYIDGVAAGTASNAQSFTKNVQAYFFRGYADNTNKNSLRNFLIHERILSLTEIKALKEKPWQIFEAPSRRIWVSAAGGATTITCSVGTAASTGVKAQISTSTVCAVGNATATGVSAQVSRSVVCSVGNASSTGVSALISPSLVCSVGNAASTGVSALVSNSVVCTVGATTATGVNAFLNLSEVCTVGNAAATGVNATVSTSGTTTITCSVGATAATGVNAQISPSVVCTVGATSATGVNAQISTSTVCAVGATTATGVKAQISASTICTVGNAAATGVNCSITIPGNQTITCTVGNAAAATATALISLGITASVANAAAAGVAATITKAVQCSVGNANATGVSSTIIALTNTTLVCTVGNAIASGVKATLVGFSVSADPVAGSRVVFGTPERRVAIPQFSQTVSRNKAARIFT